MSYNKFNNWIEIFKIKHTKWMLFLSLNSMLDNKLRKSSGDRQKSSKIFLHLRRSSGQSIREQSDRWPLFLVFKGVPGCIVGIPGHYGMFRGVPGCSEGIPGVFRGVPGVFRVCSGVFRGVPGCSGFYRHPRLTACKICFVLRAKSVTQCPRVSCRDRDALYGELNYYSRCPLPEFYL